MFTLYDFAEVGACFAAFFTMLFVLVRSPRQLSAYLFVTASGFTFLFWAAYIIIIPRTHSLTHFQHGLISAPLAITVAVWLLFLRTFARELPTQALRSRAFPLYLFAVLFLLAAVAGFSTHFFQLATGDSNARFFELTDFGKYLLGLLIVSCTFGLLQLESTWRASQGSTRKAILFPLTTFIFLLLLVLFSASIGLMYSRWYFEEVQLIALVSIAMMILVSRYVALEHQTGSGVVVSREAVYSSVGFILVGAYLALVGIAVKLLVMIGGSPRVFFSVLFAFAVVVILLALVLSGSIKARLRGFVDRSVFSGKVDLVTELSTFAEDVTALTERQEMLSKVVEVLEEKCQFKGIEVFLKGKRAGEFEIAYPSSDNRRLSLPNVEDWLFRIGKMAGREEILRQTPVIGGEELLYLREQAGEYLLPLVARKELVGFISCSAGGRISAEVRFLSESISHQFALSLLSAQQSEVLIENRELASFHKISSFVIHDIKNLISMLSMIIQNAEKKFDDPRFQKVTLETLVGAQERMKRMIDRLTSPSQQLDFEISHCDLRRIVLDLSEELKLATNSKLKVNLDLADPSFVKGNQEKLRSVINNLIINALEAMPVGGELTLRSSEDGNYAVLHVEDTGVGMTPEFMREKLFRPFQTSKPSGLGIGLYQSKELVEQMEGELSVESTVGKGTSFQLRLKKA